MLSDDNVPNNTFAIFSEDAPLETIKKILKKPDAKREWFTPDFYRCLPLSIGNQYGFVISCEYDFALFWNGGNNPEDLIIEVPNNYPNSASGLFPRLDSHFGHGILTLAPPFFIRTPKGINTMTINPPNYILPGITTMTGVIETDNLCRNFTFNLKVHLANVWITIPKGHPIAAFIPIPRYFADSFEAVFAEDIFEDEVVREILQTSRDTRIKRSEIEYKQDPPVGYDYFRGQDVYGNKFPDHQLPKKNKPSP